MKFSLKKAITGAGVTLLLAGGISPGFSSFVAEAEAETELANYSVTDENNEVNSEINSSETQSKISELEEQGYILY